jgi:hypothetical protein
LSTTQANRTAASARQQRRAAKHHPSNRITTDGRAIATFSKLRIGLATAFTNSPVGQQRSRSNNQTRSTIAKTCCASDYRINSKHTLYGRYIHDKNVLIDPFGTFITTQLPTIPSLRKRPGTSIRSRTRG